LDDVVLKKEEVGNLPAVKWKVAATLLLSRKGFNLEPLKILQLASKVLNDVVDARLAGSNEEYRRQQ
jgi:hypothetical protein